MEFVRKGEDLFCSNPQYILEGIGTIKHVYKIEIELWTNNCLLSLW